MLLVLSSKLEASYVYSTLIILYVRVYAAGIYRATLRHRKCPKIRPPACHFFVLKNRLPLVFRYIPFKTISPERNTTILYQS